MTIKLTDYVFSKHLELCNLPNSASSLTAQLQPPEKLIDGEYDEAGDVW